jgi:hypothetical protein
VKTIYKYELAVTDEQVVDLPLGGEVLSLQVQHGKPCLWVYVDPSQPSRPCRIITKGTGHPADDVADTTFLGTYQLRDGALVFHAFITETPK